MVYDAQGATKMFTLDVHDKYRRLWSDAVHYARRLTRAYDICSSIRQVFADDVTKSGRFEGLA